MLDTDTRKNLKYVSYFSGKQKFYVVNVSSASTYKLTFCFWKGVEFSVLELLKAKIKKISVLLFFTLVR